MERKTDFFPVGSTYIDIFTGLNIEQRKRLNIGVELVAKPELLLFLGMYPDAMTCTFHRLTMFLLDEPTSGLDSQTAWSICMLLRKLADQGQAVLCTIHQPSSQLCRMFDRLLLLNNRGETVYFGDIGKDASVLIDYFESKGAAKCRLKDNPAEWVLDVTSNNVLSSVTTTGNSEKSQAAEHSQELKQLSWSKKWDQSQQQHEIQDYLEHIVAVKHSEAVHGLSKGSGRSEYAASFIQQFLIVTRRIFQAYWRDPTYLYSKLSLCAGVVSHFPHRNLDHPP
jgi:ATP-binding cassette, subfamily G (WHITE), member 2, PDR